MSNSENYWEDDEDDTQDFDLNDTDLVKKLRRALKAEQKRAKELESNIGQLSKAQRERALKDVLSSKGINAKVAQFIPSEVDASEEAVNSWLEQNGDIFGAQQQAQEAPRVPDRDKANLRQIDMVTATAMSPDRVDDIEMRLSNAQSTDEILNILRSEES